MTRDAHHGLSPVILALQAGLHLLFAGLLGFVLLMASVAPTAGSSAVIPLGVAMGVTWLAGMAAHGVGSRRTRRTIRLVWIALLVAQWGLLVWLTPHAAYLVLPLFFLMLEAMPGAVGTLGVIVTTAGAVVALGLHGGWSVGGVVGPIVGAIIAVLIAFGYRALAAEAREHERLYRELLATQDRLAATERAAGAAEERERLARDIHDTVAQSLSSITLLLHAAEREDPGGAGAAHVRLARVSARDALADARRLVRDLTPTSLETRGLAAALRELGERTATAGDLEVEVLAADGTVLPMDHQTALLRIAQATLGNVVSHADASAAVIEVVVDETSVLMRVTDDGRGFDPAVAAATPRPGSFGLRSVRERVGQLGGEVEVVSAAGQGTTVSVCLPFEAPRETPR